MKADAATESAVMAVLKTMADAYANRNSDDLLATFASDADVVMYGTGSDEKRIGLAEIQAQAERDWAQTDTLTLTFDWTSISSAGSVAWVAGDVSLDLSVGEERLVLPARITFVLENRGGTWLIVHGHFSFPAAGQDEGESFPSE